MIFDPASSPHLKPWLVRALEPICDAEPGALADYILALLKHNVPEAEMRKELQVQLEEFLENECKPFIDTLFTVLRTKSYLPYSTDPPSPPPPSSQDEGIPIPLDEIMSGAAGPSTDRTRKRSFGDDDRDGRPAKGPRLSADGDFSRYGNGGHAPGAWGGQEGMGGFGMNMGPMIMGMGVNGAGPMNGRRSQGYQPPGQKRGICRDYHNQGFCARGDMCKYSHGDDAVIPSQLYPMVAPPMMPFFYNMFNQGGAYDPNERIDVRGGNRQHQRAPVLPRENGSHVLASGELPVIQDLTPSLPPDAANPQMPQNSGPQQPAQQGLPMQPPHSIAMLPGFNPSMFSGGPPNLGGMIPPYAAPPMDGNAVPSGSDGPGPSSRDNFRGRGGGHGRGRGTFGSEANSFRPGRRGDKTLVVEKIPEDKLSLEQVSAWFKKFGDVTNVAVDPHGAKALVSFATHEEARAAWKSEDAVFNNRFVKVFWHKPMEGHGQVGQRALAASASLVANLAAKDSTAPTASPSSAPSTSAPKKSPTAAALAAKQELLEKQIAEQKSLMEELSSATPERKKEIMARLRKLNEEMTTAKNADATPASAPKAVTNGGHKEADSVLDKDTEMDGTTGEETTEQLKAKLEKLKAEAASLGIADASEGYGGGYRGGYRGRGRGRGFYRGGPPVMRGGPPRGSLKLDNRPKKLLVKGIPSGDSQPVKDWYEPLGQVENIEALDSGDVLVSFKTRAAAEQALAKGTSIPGAGKVQITWYTGKSTTLGTPAAFSSVSASASIAGSSQPTTASPSMSVDKDPIPAREPSPIREDEEVVVSGWGEEDGMGML